MSNCHNVGIKYFYPHHYLNPHHYLDEMASYPYSFLATDLLYFITHAEDLDWVPFRIADYFYKVPVNELIPYQPHPMSGFTNPMEIAAGRIMRHSVLDYKKIHDSLVKDKEERKLEVFVDHFYEQMNKFLWTIPCPEDIFHKLIYMARLTSEFYRQGTIDAPHIARHLLEKAIRDLRIMTGSNMFLNLNRIAYDVNHFFENIYDRRGYTELVYEHNTDFEKDSAAKSDLESDKKKKRDQPTEVSKSTNIVGPAFIRARYRPGYANVHRIARFYKYR